MSRMDEQLNNIKDAYIPQKCKNCGNFLKVIHGNDHKGQYLVKRGNEWKEEGCSCLAVMINKKDPYTCNKCNHTVVFIHMTADELDIVSVPDCSKPEPDL